jgi:hypothetical protein
MNTPVRKAHDAYAIVAMFSQAIAFFVASRGGVELGINLLAWFVLLNIALKFTWQFATSERSWVRRFYLLAIGGLPFSILAVCIAISPWFDWLRFFRKQ